MARMITGIQVVKGTNRSQATRLASREASTWLRGWQGGVTVNAFFEPPDKIRFCVYRDGGSTSPGTRSLIAEFVVPS
jgi:hypothetical protein